MLPVSIEEQIICYADKFFSKSHHHQAKQNSIEDIIKHLKPYGQDKIEKFKSWVALFEAQWPPEKNKSD